MRGGQSEAGTVGRGKLAAVRGQSVTALSGQHGRGVQHPVGAGFRRLRPDDIFGDDQPTLGPLPHCIGQLRGGLMVAMGFVTGGNGKGIDLPATAKGGQPSNSPVENRMPRLGRSSILPVKMQRRLAATTGQAVQGGGGFALTTAHQFPRPALRCLMRSRPVCEIDKARQSPSPRRLRNKRASAQRLVIGMRRKDQPPPRSPGFCRQKKAYHKASSAPQASWSSQASAA